MKIRLNKLNESTDANIPDIVTGRRFWKVSCSGSYYPRYLCIGSFQRNILSKDLGFSVFMTDSMNIGNQSAYLCFLTEDDAKNFIKNYGSLIQGIFGNIRYYQSRTNIDEAYVRIDASASVPCYAKLNWVKRKISKTKNKDLLQDRINNTANIQDLKSDERKELENKYISIKNQILSDFPDTKQISNALPYRYDTFVIPIHKHIKQDVITQYGSGTKLYDGPALVLILTLTNDNINLFVPSNVYVKYLDMPQIILRDNDYLENIFYYVSQHYDFDQQDYVYDTSLHDSVTNFSKHSAKIRLKDIKNIKPQIETFMNRIVDIINKNKEDCDSVFKSVEFDPDSE